MSLARQEWPDVSAYDDPEITWRLSKRHHAGLIVTAAAHARVGLAAGGVHAAVSARLLREDARGRRSHE
jgi:hypothetical protein